MIVMMSKDQLYQRGVLDLTTVMTSKVPLYYSDPETGEVLIVWTVSRSFVH